LIAVQKWALLGAAIVVEVAATLSLRASQDNSSWLAVVITGYSASFVLLSLVLRAGVPIGVARSEEHTSELQSQV
jgi:small multidrug resistance pump